jgi:hypothetical protein
MEGSSLAWPQGVGRSNRPAPIKPIIKTSLLRSLRSKTVRRTRVICRRLSRASCCSRNPESSDDVAIAKLDAHFDCSIPGRNGTLFRPLRRSIIGHLLRGAISWAIQASPVDNPRCQGILKVDRQMTGGRTEKRDLLQGR